MRAITKFQANDGSEWYDAESASAREAMIAEVAVAMSVLKPHPTHLNWEGFVQQDASAILACKKRLFEIADREGVLKWWLDAQRNDHGKTNAELIACHPSWFCRMLDGAHRPLEDAYGRLCCIDSQGREWNQPYFALNPSDGKQVCVG